MALLDKFKRALTFRAAAKELADNSVLKVAATRSSEVYDSSPLKNHISKETSSYLSSILVEEIYDIINANDPVLKCRGVTCRRWHQQIDLRGIVRTLK